MTLICTTATAPKLENHTNRNEIASSTNACFVAILGIFFSLLVLGNFWGGDGGTILGSDSRE
eukprot:5300706-Amphidinium_carterae.1